VIISSLRTAAFRNLEDSLILTDSENIFLVGENGQGKTNFLEALYFCVYASSFRGARDGEIAKNDGPESEKRDFSSAITVKEKGGPDNLSGEILVKYEKGKKTVFTGGKKVEDRKDLLSLAPCIVFCHEDMEFVAGSPERRRWFFDQVLCLYDSVYLDDLRRYKRALKSRNSVLRGYACSGRDGEPLLDALDQQCAQYGAKLIEKRETAARLFSEVFAPLYREVAGIPGISVQYRPSWKGGGEEALGCLRKRRSQDIAAGLSLCGPHRDRYLFIHNGGDFSARASTGQRRLLALLLRAAQARRFSGITGKNPVLLLDDVLLEMDGEKRRRFLSVLPARDQAFYTFLPEEPFERRLGSLGFDVGGALVYRVRDGRLEAERQ